MPGLPLPATATVKDTLRRQQQRQQRQRPPHRTLTGAAILAGQRPGHEEEDHPVPPVDAPPLDAPPLEEQALEVALDGIEHAADVCERAYNEYNSARAASVVAKHEWQRANREVDDRKQRRSDAQRAWAREMSNGKQNGKDPINLDEWVQERDGFTGRTEWVNVNTQERQTMKPKAAEEEAGGAFNDVTKETFHEAVASEEDAVAYMTTKKVQWGAAEDRAVVAEEAMVVAKERLREVSLHVLPNIAEERAEENLPLPSAVDHEGWAERRRRQGGGEGKSVGREMSMSQEERDYEKHWEEEMTQMKAQVVSIHQEDQSISDWAARAAKLSLKKHIVLGKDGAITSST